MHIAFSIRLRYALHKCTVSSHACLLLFAGWCTDSKFQTRFLAPFPPTLPALWSLVSPSVFLKLETIQSLRGRRTGMDTEVSRYYVDGPARVLSGPSKKYLGEITILRLFVAETGKIWSERNTRK